MEIHNLKEKRILVERFIIKNQLEPTDESILKAWGVISSSDKPNVDADLIEWIRSLASKKDSKHCDALLNKVRQTGERNLKEKGRRVGYGAKLVVAPKQALATYNIFTVGRKMSGNYYNLSKRLGRMQ